MLYIPTILVCCAVTFSAWAYGGTNTWAVYVLGGLSVSAAISSMFLRSESYSCKSSCLHFSEFFKSPFNVSLFLFLLFVSIQAVNHSHRYSILRGLSVCNNINWLPASVSRELTLRALLLLTAYICVYKITSSILNTRAVYILIGVIIASAFLMSMLTLIMGGGESELVGMFLNDNNFAEYINLILPVTLGSARTLHEKRLSRRSNPAGFVYLCSSVMAAAVLFTGSRAGASITVLIVTVWILFEIKDRLNSGLTSRHALLWGLALVVPFVAILYLSGIGDWYRQLANPVTGLEDVVATRRMVIGDTLRMFLDRKLYGVGAGAFHAAFPYYQDESVFGFYRNAHNDWIQWLSELGVVGSVFGAVALVTAFGRCNSGKSKAYLPRYIERGIWIGLAGVTLHSMLDFPFRIPAISVVVAVWIGLLTRRRCRSRKQLPRA